MTEEQKQARIKTIKESIGLLPFYKLKGEPFKGFDELQKELKELEDND